MKEKKKQIDAFAYFFNLLEKGYTLTESIGLTGEHCNVTERTVWNWYSQLDWEKRTQDKRAKILEKMEEEEIKTLAQNRLNYLKIMHKILDNFIQDDFPVEINNVRDLETVIRNCLVLQEAPTEYTKNMNTNMDINANTLFDEEKMRKILEEEKEEEEEEEDL